MRFEQIIAAVTRNLVNAMVREIEATRAFVNVVQLHRWLQRTPLGMPISTDATTILARYGGWTDHGVDGRFGLKRGSLAVQPLLQLASCRDGRARG